MAEAEDSDDGVWAVADEVEEFSDWEIAKDSDTDWALLSDFDSEENKDLPAHSTIPDAHPADAEQLRSIMLQSYNICKAFIQMPRTTTPSMPGLQYISESGCSVGSMPGLQSVSATEYSFNGNPSPNDEAASCSDGSIHILPEDGLASEPSIFDESTKGTGPSKTSGCSHCSPHIPSTCGGSKPMTPFREQLINYTPIASRPITAADKQVFYAIGKGDMCIRIPNGTTTIIILLKDVLYAPAMGVNIISVSRITATGFAVLFRANFCRIFDTKNKHISHIHVTSNGLYCVNHSEAVLSAGMKVKLTMKELHPRMGHITPDAMRKLVEDK